MENFHLRNIADEKISFISKLSNGGIRFLISKLPSPLIIIRGYKFLYPYIKDEIQSKIDKLDNIKNMSILIHELFKMGDIIPKLVYIIGTNLIKNGFIYELFVKESDLLHPGNTKLFIDELIETFLEDKKNNNINKNPNNYIPLYKDNIIIYSLDDIDDKNLYFSPVYIDFESNIKKNLKNNDNKDINLLDFKNKKIIIGSPEYNSFILFLSMYKDKILNGDVVLEELKRTAQPILSSYGESLKNIFALSDNLFGKKKEIF